jgi:outer membrane receptor protein involved in Fe transport
MARGNAGTILVLWNGVPINSPADNQRALGRDLPLSVVHRVEILSGPGGVVWGANAFLGIVNILTLREGSAPGRAEVTLRVGDGRGDQRALGVTAHMAERFFSGRVRAYANLTLHTSRDAALAPPFDAVLGPFAPPDNDSVFPLRTTLGDSHNGRDVFLPLTVALDVGALRFDLFYPLVGTSFREFNTFNARTDYRVDDMDARHEGGELSERIDRLGLLSVQVGGKVDDRTSVVGRAYLTGFENLYVDEVAVAAGELTERSVVSHDRYGDELPQLIDGAYRLGVAVDGTHTRKTSDVIGGAEVYVEGMRPTFRQVGGGQSGIKGTKRSLPGNRLILAAFVDDKLRLGKRFQASVGARGQFSPGAYDPLLLGSLALLWNPTEKLYLKLNIAQGFRPPPLLFILGNDDFQTNALPHRQSNPDLKAERSLAAETELSAIVLRHHRRFQFMALRLGVQVTQVDDLVVMQNAFSINAGRRIMRSVEARADVALTGNHRVVGAYGYLEGTDTRTGPLRNVANHKVHVGVEARLVSWLDALVSATLLGPQEDLNRLAVPTSTSSAGRFVASASSVAVDRLPPAMVMRVGLIVHVPLGLPLDASLIAYNVFDSAFAIPDQDFDKRESPFPIPAAGRSVFLSMTARL